MKKRIIRIILTLLLFISFRLDVCAATASATISVSTSKTVVGNSGTATLTISSNEVIGQIYGTFTCGGLGDKDLVYSIGPSDTPSKTRTYTINWNAKTAGTYTCEVRNLEIGTLETQDWPTASATKKTIEVVNATSGSTSGNSGSGSSGGSSGNKKPSSGGSTTSNKKEYSTNNNLKNLVVEGYELEPGFSKDVVEYKLTVDQKIEKINIIAEKEDSKASVSGAGEKNLSLGENTIEVKVTAENGNEKIYKLIVSVEDLHPIKVNIGEDEYTIVKKNNDLIEKLELFEETTIKIDEQDVVAYTNEVTKITLVLLKNKENNINYYIYDITNNSYIAYKYIKINNVTLQLLNPKNVSTKYHKYTTTINEKEVDIYKIDKKNKIGLIYGTNIVTGYTGYYQYDEEESTISKYYQDEINLYRDEVVQYQKYMVILVGAFSFVVIIASIVSIIKNKRRKTMRKF